jgi:hypothetical protein
MVALLAALAGPVPAAGTVDAHLHYDRDDADLLTPAEIIAILDDNWVAKAVVTSQPPALVQKLHATAPNRILPMLGIYRAPADKQHWTGDRGVVASLERNLQSGTWCGIGELHLVTTQRHSPVLAQVVRIAADHQLPLMLHTEPAVIDHVFMTVPEVTVVWAHAGTYPYPDLLRDYLQRYPRLYADLSMRNERIAPDGVIAENWAWLLMEYTDRFMIGVDTFHPGRWREFGTVQAATADWLAQLPPRVANAIAAGNADRIYAAACRNRADAS